MQIENLKYPTVFPMVASDLYGYVSPWVMFQTISENVAREMDLDGVGIVRMLEEVGATWMLGQLVLEYSEPLMHSIPLEMEFLPRKTCGISSVRQAVIRSGDRAIVRCTEKFLAVSFTQRKAISLSALDHMWQRPGGEPAQDFGWVLLPEKMELAEEVMVRRYWCDPNGHMTTFQYLNLICELAGYWAGRPRILERLQVDFRKEFMPGERISLYRGEENGIICISGMHENGQLGFSASVKLSAEEYPPARVMVEELIKE